MNAEIKNLVSVLEILSSALDVRNRSVSALQNSTKEGHVKKNVLDKYDKPQQKPILPIPTYIAPFVLAVIAGVLIIAAVVVLILSIISGVSGRIAFSIILAVLAVIVTVIGMLMAKSISKDITKIKQTNEENTHFNSINYPMLLKGYNDKIKAAEEEYDKSRAEVIGWKEDAEGKIQKCAEYLEESGMIYSEKYYPDVDRVIEILKEGRADSLKEAINLMLDDKQKETMIRMQREEAARTQRQIEAQNQRIQELTQEAAAARQAAERAAFRAELFNDSYKSRSSTPIQDGLSKSGINIGNFQKANFERAQQSYKQASYHYNNAVARGDSKTAAMQKHFMDEAMADMIKYK